MFNGIGGAVAFMMASGAPVPAPNTYTTTGTQTVLAADWGGATSAFIECYGGGAGGGNPSGGGAGAYSAATVSLAGLTGLYLDVPAASFGAGGSASVKQNNSSGTTVCSAAGGTIPTGGDAASGVGDTKYSGGNGSGSGGGGGAAGPNGNGGNASGTTGGAGNGGLAGNGGSFPATAATNYGGGAQGNEFGSTGRQGVIKITWM